MTRTDPAAAIPAGKAKYEALSPRAKRATSALLISLCSFVAVLAILLLAATLTQGRLSSVSINGVNLSIWNLDSMRESWDWHQDEIRKTQISIRQHEASRPEVAARIYEAEGRALQAGQRLELLISVLVSQRPGDFSGIPPNTQTGLRAEYVLAQIGKLPDSPIKEKWLGQIQELYQDHLTAQTQVQAMNKAHENWNKEIVRLEDSLADKSEVMEDRLVKFDEATKTRLQNAFYEMRPEAASEEDESLLMKSRRLLRDLWRVLVTMQPEVLTLWLVVAMGLLGSSLQIANSFIGERRASTIGNYFLRFGVGAVAALAIFVVAKAGIPIIADASKLGGDTPINPYFVSFIAIISGLLSDRAIRTVQSHGNRFFAEGERTEPDRWARAEVGKRIDEMKLSKEVLADYLSVDLDGLSKIVSGEVSTKADQQFVIAIYLHGEVRELFTDIPPKSSKPAASGQGAGT